MTPADLLAWRASLGLSQAATARSLGLSVRAWQNYENGTRPPPKCLVLAIRRGVMLANLAARLDLTTPADNALAAEIRTMLGAQAD